jgi:hypothetical protein
MSNKISLFLSMIAMSGASGCGTYVPNLQEFYEPPDRARIKVENLVAHVECEVITGVQSVLLTDQDLAIERKRANLKQEEVLSELKKWAAQITLTLTVDEKSTLNPGIAFNQIYPNATSRFLTQPSVITPQSFSLGLAGAFSSEAARKETLSLYLDFKTFTDTKSLVLARAQRDSGQQPPCNEIGGIFIDGDLKFKDWLFAATLPAAVEGGIEQNYIKSLESEEKVAKKDVLSHEVTFVVLYGANVTPTLKLVNFSANPGTSPLFGVQRTNTQDVIITLGPPQQGQTLSTAAQNTTLASQIGLAVANAIRNTQ